MSTYNSKFSGAEIDALLEKVASGQVGGGGGGSSEKEELAKAIGATHKHTIMLSMESDGMIMKIQGVTYSNSADQLTVDRICDFLMFTDGAYVDGHWGMSANGYTLVGSVTWCLNENRELVTIVSRVAIELNYVKEVDFTDSTTTPGNVMVFNGMGLPVSELISQGYTFTDDVTEL